MLSFSVQQPIYDNRQPRTVLIYIHNTYPTYRTGPETVLDGCRTFTDALTGLVFNFANRKLVGYPPGALWRGRLVRHLGMTNGNDDNASPTWLRESTFHGARTGKASFPTCALHQTFLMFSGMEFAPPVWRLAAKLHKMPIISVCLSGINFHLYYARYWSFIIKGCGLWPGGAKCLWS